MNENKLWEVLDQILPVDERHRAKLKELKEKAGAGGPFDPSANTAKIMKQHEIDTYRDPNQDEHVRELARLRLNTARAMFEHYDAQTELINRIAQKFGG